VTLAQKLLDLGYLNLFQRLDHDALEAVWRDDGRDALLALALDPEAEALARFLAAEIAFIKDPSSVPEDAKAALAELYAKALKKRLVRMANDWTLPDGAVGQAGEHVVKHLGAAALEALSNLLDDDTTVVYQGSQEATFDHPGGFRIKDIAAVLIEAIRRKAKEER